MEKLNQFCGYHQFRNAEGDNYGSFLVYYIEGFGHEPGWYWQAEFPGCLPDGEPCGPFPSSRAAWLDAQGGAETLAEREAIADGMFSAEHRD